MYTDTEIATDFNYLHFRYMTLAVTLTLALATYSCIKVVLNLDYKLCAKQSAPTKKLQFLILIRIFTGFLELEATNRFQNTHFAVTGMFTRTMLSTVPPQFKYLLYIIFTSSAFSQLLKKTSSSIYRVE